MTYLLEKIYLDLLYSDKITKNTSPDFIKRQASFLQLESEFYNMVEDPIKESYDSLISNYTNLVVLDQAAAFAYGFKLGSLISQEISAFELE